MTSASRSGDVRWTSSLTRARRKTPIPTNLFPERILAGSCYARESRNLNVEIVNKNPLLPTDRKWAIRFSPCETVTVVLGMRDYGRGWFSAYFAGLVADRLGLPFRRVRIYYSATLPAVSQTPRIAGILLYGSQPGSVAAAAGDIISEMCELVIEKGRLASAAVAGVGAADVDFDASTGCFFARNTGWSGRTLDIAKIARDGRVRCPLSSQKIFEERTSVANEAV